MTGAPVAILAYHRVATVNYDPLRLAVRAETLARHLDALEGVDVVPLHTLATPADHPRIALTFDDGYDDNRTAAMPLLRDRGLPFTFFLVAGAVDSGAGFWWDRLAQLVSNDPRSARRVLARVRPDLVLRVATRLPWRRLLFRTLFIELRQLPVHRVLELLDVEASGAAALPRLIDPTALAEIVACPGAQIGAHTCSHSRLSALPLRDQVTEIAESRRRLEDLTGLSVRTFAFPYGDRGSYDPDTVDAVRDAGFELACVNHLRRADEPLVMPRLTVFDWDEATFRERLLLAFQASVA